MLLKIEKGVVINTEQIAVITESNTMKYPSVIVMSTGDRYLMEEQPEELADKIAKVVSLADVYYFRSF